LVELQQVADRYAGAADFERQRHRHIEDHVEVEVGTLDVGIGHQGLEGGALGFFGIHGGLVVVHGCIRFWKEGTARAGFTLATLMALRPLWVPNEPVNSGVCSTCSVTVSGRSIGITSPTFSRHSSRRLIWRWAIALLSSTSASCSWARMARVQPSARE